MRHNPQPQEMYRHFKGKTYQIRCLAKHSETGEMMVIYQAMYGDFQIYARELSSFMEEVDRKKYPDVTCRYRFELLNAQNDCDTEPDVERETVQETVRETVTETKTIETEAEELNIDPLVLQFLDADSYERRLEILSMLYNRIDDEMINIMAVAVDVEVKEGSIESRYDELRNCLLTFARYECNRLR